MARILKIVHFAWFCFIPFKCDGAITQNKKLSCHDRAMLNAIVSLNISLITQGGHVGNMTGCDHPSFGLLVGDVIAFPTFANVAAVRHLELEF